MTDAEFRKMVAELLTMYLERQSDSVEFKILLEQIAVELEVI